MIYVSSTNILTNSPKQTGQDLLKKIATNLKSGDHEIDYKPSGAPFIKNHPEFFCSISHSPKIAIAAIAQNQIGIDIEEIRNRKESVLDFVSNDEEKKIIGNENTLLKIWTIKESVSKALELGAQMNFADIQIIKELEMNKFLVQIQELYPQTWYVNIMKRSNSIIAFASTEPNEIIHFLD